MSDWPEFNLFMTGFCLGMAFMSSIQFACFIYLAKNGFKCRASAHPSQQRAQGGET